MYVKYFLGLVLLVTLVSVPCIISASETVDVWTARQAIDFARKNSPDSQLARQRLLQADALLMKAEAGFYPQLQMSGTYSQTNNPMYSFGNILNQGEFKPGIDFNNPGRTDNLGLGIELKYRFYNGGQDLARKNAAEAGVDLSAAAGEEILHNLEFEIFRAFQRIVQGGEILQARQMAHNAVSASLAVAQSRYDAGKLLKADLLNLEVEKFQTTEEIIQAKHDLELAKRILLVLLGIPGDDLQFEVDTRGGPAMPMDTNPSRRPELQKLNAAIKAAEAKLAAARGSRLPTVDGFARYQYDQGTVLDGNGDSWMAGVNLNFMLFDGHLAVADIAFAEAQLGSLRAEQKKLELAISLEVSRAKLALEQARQRLQVTQKRVEHAVESENLTKARFNAGGLLVSELIDSENRLTDARVHNALASSAVKIATADLRRAAGLPQYPIDNNQVIRLENQP